MVDGTGLENRRTVKRTEGSNPSLSAKSAKIKTSQELSKVSSDEEEYPSG